MIPLPPSSPFPARALPQPPPGSVRSASLALERARRAREEAAHLPAMFSGLSQPSTARAIDAARRRELAKAAKSQPLFARPLRFAGAVEAMRAAKQDRR